MRKIVFPIILVIIALIVAFLNYTPGTVLSGWDTLHPEFNLGLYFQRIFWGVWQQHQGLGAVAAQAHASELGRLWYFVLGSFLPENLFRYGYFWITLIIGPLGIFYLLKKIVSEKAAFVGGLFYLLNLGTMQHYYLPLEMFATAYAFLPWLFWAVVNKKLKLLVLIFLISAPMAHTPTLWMVNFVALTLFAIIYDWRWGVKVGLIGLIVNSFWLMPSFYYLFTHGPDVANSHISQQFSGRAIATNREFANIVDIALIKGYLFDWGNFNFTGWQFSDLFPVWKAHLSNLPVQIIGFGTAISVFLGVILTLRQKLRMGIALLPVLLLSVFGLLIVLDVEVFRFPFTKFSLLLMLSMAVYLAIVVEKIKKIWFIFVFAVIYYMWPVFTGNLICECERVNIAPEYNQVFGYFEKLDPNTRIAPFPLDSIYGWGYYRWGYEGAGFRWFGLPQPLLDREFDRWMPQNENYYWEIFQAVYSKNLPLFESVLNKYRVNWLLVDTNIINPSSPKSLYTDELERLVGQSDSIKLEKEFGKIKIYSVALRIPEKSFISVASSLPSVTPGYKWGNLDQAYFDIGDYTTDYRLPTTVYPYRTLFSGRSQIDLEFDPSNISLGEKVDPKNYPSLSHRDGYLVKIKAKNISGKPFLFWIEDLNSRRAVLETYLPGNQSPPASAAGGLVTSYFVLPPMEPDGLGYSFHLDSNIIGKEVSKNELESLEVYKIDYWSLVTRHSSPEQMTNVLMTNDFAVDHPNPAFYRINLATSHQAPATIVLSQSYDTGWVAIGAGRHILVNNWANGWELSGGEQTVYLFFWPQLLEFAGFGLLTTLIIYLIIISEKSKNVYFTKTIISQGGITKP